MKAGDKAHGSNDELTIHGVKGVTVVRNDHINSRQKEIGFDIVEVHITGEDYLGRPKCLTICLFGKEGVQL